MKAIPGKRKNPLGGVIFFSASELIDANGKTIRSFDINASRRLREKMEAFPHNGYLIAEPTGYLFHGCSCLVHKRAFADIGAFDEKLRLLNDVDLWYRLYSSDYNVHYLNEPLVKGRIHAKQISRSIGYSYHNPEQDMFWNRSLDFLFANYPTEEKLFFLFGRNAYLKTRNAEGDRAFANIRVNCLKKKALKAFYVSRACTRSFAKKVYLKLMRA